MKPFRSFIVLAVFILVYAKGQVCCSLVGAIDNGGGTSSTNWGTYWPSLFDDKNELKWVAGFNATHTDDNDLNIRYGTALVSYIQVSRYMGERSIGYIQAEGSWLRLQELISFDQSSSRIYQIGVRAGIRHLLPKKWGYGYAEINHSSRPNFSNRNFAFKIGSVPVISIGWTNRYKSPWFLKYPKVFADYSLSFAYGKNLKEQDDVYLDDNISFHFSSSVYSYLPVSISPFSSLNIQNLLAPLSPWDLIRQRRWLGTVNIGFDLTPNNQKWSWMHIRFAYPIYSWASKVGFPDGTEPVARVTLSMIMNSNLFENL